MATGRFNSVFCFPKICMSKCCHNGERKKTTRRCMVLAVLIVLICYFFLRHREEQLGRYAPWTPSPLPRRPEASKHFVLTRDQDVYMYSAFANLHQPVNQHINIIITTLAATRADLHCCVLLDGQQLYIAPARTYFQYHNIDLEFIAHIVEYFHSDIFYARQYSCSVPNLHHNLEYVTLTSSQCSSEIKDYVKVVYPPRVPNGLALCGKIAYNGGLDPEKVIEWVEVQRMLGVDKILLFDLGNPENLTRVFTYYQNLGVLDLQPYELPGKPINRTIWGADVQYNQFHQDESMVVMECGQRMSGYSFVLSHDVDEFIIPRHDVTLKQLLQEKTQQNQDAAGFYFQAEFMVFDWGASHPEESLMVTRYRRATLPHWECRKYAFLPHRTTGTITHDFFPRTPYKGYKMDSRDAIIHHYRRCPHVWKTCQPETIIDDVMTRFKDLPARVQQVRSATQTHPNWSANL